LSVRQVNIIRQSQSSFVEKPDLVAIEEPLEIRVGFGQLDNREQRSLAVTMRTPGHDFELAIGFLFTEGIVHSYQEIESIKHCEDLGRQEDRENVVRIELKPEVEFDFKKLQRNFYTTSSCGVCGKSSIEAVTQECPAILVQWKVSPELINRLPETLRQAQHVFEHTGGLHASGLFDQEGNLVLIREDVGRHNALDKVIGAMLIRKEIPLSNTILLVSGRASFELVQKAAMAGIPVLAAVGAPSSLAVSLATGCNMTLIGFVRDERYNIYCGEKRLGYG
jgi:FdhD protein